MCVPLNGNSHLVLQVIKLREMDIYLHTISPYNIYHQYSPIVCYAALTQIISQRPEAHMNNLFRKKVKCSSFSYRQIHFTRTRSCLVLVMLQLVTQCEETTTFSPIEICPDQSLPVEPLQKQQLTHLCRSSQSIMFVLCTHQF